MRCPHCGCEVLSPAAEAELDHIRKVTAHREFIYEGVRPAYETGEYRDSEIDELLAVGAIEPHPDPTNGWIVKKSWR